MADRTTERPSTHPRRRRPHVKRHKGNRFSRVIAAFNRSLDQHFPVEHFEDKRGRPRTRGRGRRHRASEVLRALASLQARLRSGIVYIGYEKLGCEFHRSRSTAYRGVTDLARVNLLCRKSGGGKTYDEVGRVVECANGYTVPEDLVGPEQHQPRQPRLGKAVQAPLSRKGVELDEDARERVARWKAMRAARAGPAP